MVASTATATATAMVMMMAMAVAMANRLIPPPTFRNPLLHSQL